MSKSAAPITFPIPLPIPAWTNPIGISLTSQGVVTVNESDCYGLTFRERDRDGDRERVSS